MSSTTDDHLLTPRERLLVDAIAERVADVLRSGAVRVRLVDAATLADALGVSRDCVYVHASELGGERIGNGPRGRLRFDLDRALAAWTSRFESERSHKYEVPAQARVSRRTKPRRLGSGPNLLPIRGVADYSDVHEGRP
ncbi:MAG: hypothetical protein WBQ21_11665 [Solirubrobacteraceae bacterium]